MSTPEHILDTTPEAESVLIQLLRAKPPTCRLEDAVSASNRADQCKEAIRRMNPRMSEDDVKLRFIELNYGAEIADRVRNYRVGKS